MLRLKHTLWSSSWRAAAWQAHRRRASRWVPVDQQTLRSWCWRRHSPACNMFAGGVAARVLKVRKQVGESTPLALLALSGGSSLCKAAREYQWGKGAEGHRSKALGALLISCVGGTW